MISNINVFNEMNFKELKKLYLRENNIKLVKPLENVNLKELKELDLKYNSKFKKKMFAKLPLEVKILYDKPVVHKTNQKYYSNGFPSEVDW